MKVQWRCGVHIMYDNIDTFIWWKVVLFSRSLIMFRILNGSFHDDLIWKRLPHNGHFAGKHISHHWIPIIRARNALLWRHNGHDGVSNHQPRGCLLNRLFIRRSKKTSKLRVTGLCVGNSPGPVNSPHKGPVTRKMFPFDDFIMCRGTYKSPLDCFHKGQ